MKKIFFVILIAIPFITKAQKNNPEFPLNSDGKIEYTEIVSIDGASKDQLYSRANSFFSKVYKNPQAVIQLQDKDAGRVIGNAVVITNHNAVKYTLEILSKDNKYKYSITGFDAINTNSNGGPVGNINGKKPFGAIGWDKMKKVTNENILALIELLKKSMSKSDDF